MDLERHGDTLTIRVRRDFNLMAVRHLKYHLNDASRVRVDLRRARLVDTEAVMALFRLMQSGITVRLLDPPAIFYEVLEVLELEEAFDLEQLVERKRA
jgi:ABC-type transporter Mla MlaB component